MVFIFPLQLLGSIDDTEHPNMMTLMPNGSFNGLRRGYGVIYSMSGLGRSCMGYFLKRTTFEPPFTNATAPSLLIVATASSKAA